MRKTTAATLVAASVLGGAAGGMALYAPAIAGAQSADTTTTAAPSGPGARMGEVLAGLVNDGTLTQAQADKVAAAFEAARPADGMRGPGGPGGPGRGPGRGLDAAATAIGVDQETLRSALQSGQTIAQVAQQHGVSAQRVIDAIVADQRAHLAEDVASGRLTQAKADEAAANAVERATNLVNGTAPKPPGA